jgi:hypothetical protein
VLGVPLEPLGVPLEPLGVPLEPLGEPLEPLGEPLEPLGDPLEPLGDPLLTGAVGLLEGGWIFTGAPLEGVELDTGTVVGELELPGAFGVSPEVPPAAVVEDPVELDAAANGS